MDSDLEITQKKIVDDLQNFCGALKKKKRKKIRQMMKMPVNKRKNLNYLNF